MLHIPALWYFDISVIRPHRFRRLKFAIMPPCFVYHQYLWNIALQPSVGCYNLWADLRCWGYSSLGEKSLLTLLIRCANWVALLQCELLLPQLHLHKIHKSIDNLNWRICSYSHFRDMSCQKTRRHICTRSYRRAPLPGFVLECSTAISTRAGFVFTTNHR